MRPARYPITTTPPHPPPPLTSCQAAPPSCLLDVATSSSFPAAPHPQPLRGRPFRERVSSRRDYQMSKRAPPTYHLWQTWFSKRRWQRNTEWAAVASVRTLLNERAPPSLPRTETASSAEMQNSRVICPRQRPEDASGGSQWGEKSPKCW